MITVEFFSIPRRRAGVDQVQLPAANSLVYSELLDQLAIQLPGFGDGCLDDAGHLQTHYLAMLENDRRLSDPATLIPNDSRVLILSADVGG
jgi:molybdopterin converting factor small subunit